jgi:Cdc6-like AAA superfamily ATPase
LLSSGAIALLYLAIDYLVHDNQCYLKYKIKKKLMDFRSNESTSTIIERALPSYDLNIPTAVVGETGTGKTTLLEQVLRDRKSKNLPTLLLSLRVAGQTEVAGAPKMVRYCVELVFPFQFLI